jgi:predicted nucleotidyltransferase
MDRSKVQQLLKTPEYDFLRNNKSLNSNIALLTLGGSHAYGTNNENSDLDIRGIYTPSKRDILTMKCHDKPFVNTKTDTTIYPLKQIITLLSNCNPNTIEILGTRECDIFMISEEGRLLKDNINIFLSKRAMHSFGGYATAQLRRLQNALARDSYPQVEKEKHILDSIKHQRNHIERNYHAFNNTDIKLYLDKSDKTDFDEEMFVDINLKHYPLRDLKAISSEWLNVIKDYNSLNHRNSKKDDLHLNKHSMHLIRLLIMGTEILEGNGVNTYRENDLELLMNLRNGVYVGDNNDYSYIFELVDKYESKLNYAFKHSELPKEPNQKLIDDLVAEINNTIMNEEE